MQYLGEFQCKMDAKGRMRIPSTLIRQLNGAEQEGFVINRGFEKCLTLYTKTEWSNITKEINALNQFVKKNRAFVRYFYRGATELSMDSTDRILIPKRLQTYSKIQKDIVVFAYMNKIELWAKEEYEQCMDDEPMDFGSLAEEVLGN